MGEAHSIPTERDTRSAAELAEENIQLRRRLRQQSTLLDRLTLIAKSYIDHELGMSEESILDALKLLARTLRGEIAFLSVRPSHDENFLEFCESRGRPVSAKEFNARLWAEDAVRTRLLELETLCYSCEEEESICSRFGVKNLVIVPLSYEGQFGGFIGIASYAKSHAVDDDISRYVRLAGEILHHSVLLHRLEQQHLAHEALFRKVIDINPNFIFAKDRAGRFILVNEAVADAYGTKVEDLVGKTDADFNPDPKECEHFLKDDLEVMEQLCEKFVPEEKITDSKGNVRYLQTVKRPIVGDDGIARAVLGVSTDITDRKHAEKEREKLLLKMQQTQRLESLGVLAGGIAHDFNNLLMGIVGHCELADSLKEDPRWVSDKLRQIRVAAQRATELTNQLLAYSGRGRFVIDDADISELLRELGSLLGVVVSKKAKLQFELAARLPSVEVDVSQIRQVFMNLLANASDALGDQPGDIVVRTKQVDVRANAVVSLKESLRFKQELDDGSYVLIQVSDTGMGMDESTLERIFDPFFTTKFTGRGLGLAAVHGIIKGHRGAIRVDSKPSEGTTFSVLLPIKAGAQYLPEKAQTTAEDAARKQMPQLEILLVDDEPVALNVMEQMLRFLGHKVVVARDGREAVRKFSDPSYSFSLVLLDLTMPEMDGYETWTELFKVDPNIPVMLMSGYCETEIRKRFSDVLAGAYRSIEPHTQEQTQKPRMSFIQKPFGQAQLTQKMKELGVAPEEGAQA